MSQWERAGVEDGPGAPSETGELQSIGSYLAAQRGIRGITLEELAQLTRIPLRSLERLEAGSYDGVTDGFVRGFVRTVAESLGLEPDDTVARMLREPAFDAEFGSRASPFLRRGLVALALVAVLALAAGVIRAVVSSSTATPVVAPEHVFRRDSVRMLADLQREAAGSARWRPAPAWPDEGPIEIGDDSESPPTPPVPPEAPAPLALPPVNP